jgi:hypothetical protein
LHAILAEVRNLRIELLQERLERTELRIADVQQKLRAAEAERNQASREQQVHAQEVVEVQQRLAQPSLGDAERAELEAYGTQLTTSAAAKLAEHISSVARRETNLHSQLEREQRVRHQLLESLRSVGATPPI